MDQDDDPELSCYAIPIPNYCIAKKKPYKVDSETELLIKSALKKGEEEMTKLFIRHLICYKKNSNLN